MMLKAWLLFVVAVLLVSMRGAAADDQRDGLNYVQIHAWLMWSSFGLLLPLGAILIRSSRPRSCPTLAIVSPTRGRTTFYIHIMVQCAGLGTASAGITVLLRTVGWSLDHTHQKLGMALWIIVLIMPFNGTLRPTKGTKPWPYWYVLHWLFGTGIIILGIVNIFIGIHIYQDYVGIRIGSQNLAFTVQVAAMGTFYFFQDKWSYILGQESHEKPKLAEENKNTLESHEKPKLAEENKNTLESHEKPKLAEENKNTLVSVCVAASGDCIIPELD